VNAPNTTRFLFPVNWDSIGIGELGNPGWDPICFCTSEGFLYYMPALIRLTLDTIDGNQYLDQFLFHLIGDGADNRRVAACTIEQRKFVARFLEYLIEHYAVRLEEGLYYSDDILKAHDIWKVEN
jgi:hypothetical protein